MRLFGSAVEWDTPQWSVVQSRGYFLNRTKLMSTETTLLQTLAKPVVFQMPRRLTAPPSWTMHAPLAMWLIEMLRPSVFVELGTYSGTSYCAFCQAVQQLSIPSKCYAVDTWKGDPHASMYGEEVFKELGAYHDANYASFSRLVREDFDSARAHFADGSIDLLHIDGYHTYDAVKHDFESWLPKLSSRGVVLFHDTNVHERDFGVAQLWAELKQRYPSLEVLHGHGLGILLVGSDVPAGIQRVAEQVRASADDLRLFQDFFSHLGRVCLQQVQNDEVKRQLSEMQNGVTELQAYVAQLEQDRATLLARCDQLEAEREEVRESLEKEVTHLQGEVLKERSQPKGMLAPLRIMKRAVVGPRTE